MAYVNTGSIAASIAASEGIRRAQEAAAAAEHERRMRTDPAYRAQVYESRERDIVEDIDYHMRKAQRPHFKWREHHHVNALRQDSVLLTRTLFEDGRGAMPPPPAPAQLDDAQFLVAIETWRKGVNVCAQDQT